MAKAPSSVIGVDIGRYALKSVLLQRRGTDQLAITHFGSYVPAAPATDADTLTHYLKALLKDMGGSAKACAVSVSSPDALLRIIEQPETPTTILRDALRLNGMALLNQDCRAFVLDCDQIPTTQTLSNEPGMVPQRKYLVGGLPRKEVEMIGTAVQGAIGKIQMVQLAPVSIFNAFELARPEVFNEGAFFLIDIGHSASTMMVGAKRELMLVRTIDFGGNALIEALSGLSGEPRDQVIQALEQEDEVMVEYTRVSMNNLAREIASSIGFFEHSHEQTVSRIFVSGGPARSRTFLKLMKEELGIPCEAWNAAEKCENAVTAQKRAQFAEEALDFNVACGAAAEAFKETAN
ncbi:pilus assembly protein PilM [Verrucomicrobiota bacterium sgz303538]